MKLFSTLSNDLLLPTYQTKTGVKVSAHKAESGVLIKGGANVANKHGITMKAIETEVSEEDYKIIKESPVFKRMVERGFISTSKPKEPKKDKSAPLTEKDVKAKNKDIEIKTNEDK